MTWLDASVIARSREFSRCPPGGEWHTLDVICGRTPLAPQLAAPHAGSELQVRRSWIWVGGHFLEAVQLCTLARGSCD